MVRFSILPLVSLLIIICSCNNTNESQAPISSDYAHHFLINKILLEIDSTTIVLEDYFKFPAKIDSFIMPVGLRYQVVDEGNKMILISNDSLALLSTIKLQYDDHEFAVQVQRSRKKRFQFSFDAQGEKYETVQLVGDINAWNPSNTPLSFDGNMWLVNLALLPGNYQYQMVVDGEWMLDPNNPKRLSNGIGGWNSKLTIKGSDNVLLPTIYSHSFEKNSIKIGYENEVTDFVALWENQEIATIKNKNKTSLDIPEVANTIKRSFLRVSAFNKSGVSNELLIPIEYGRPIIDAKKLNREDKARNISYFVLVDRFKNGTTENDNPINDPTVHPRANYYGGDVQGILEKLEDGYFEELGINTIWLSPIVKNPEGAYGLFNKGGIQSSFSAYHGYWPISFTQIDPHFGTEEAFKNLIEKAHKKDINVFIDFVANHVHEEHPVYQTMKDSAWTTDLYLPDGSLNTERWDEHRLTTWFDVFLPTLNLEKQEVTEMLSDSALYWVEHFNIDGFRHDAAKHIPNNFWRTLTKKLKHYSVKNHKQITQIGETYGTPELINSYLNTGMLDGQFDFNVFDALLQSICKEEVGFGLLKEKLEQSFEYYGVNNLMGYISGNQDRARFMALASGDVRFDEDAKLAGWKRNIQKRTPEAFAKLNIMNTILLTIPGIPVIFYGDEIGMTGGNDPDCRRMMRFDSLTKAEMKLKSQLKQMTHLRKSNMAFLYGDFNFLKAENDILVYSRKYFDAIGIVFINNSKEEKELRIELPKHYNNKNLNDAFSDEFLIEENILTLIIKPLSVRIITN